MTKENVKRSAASTILFLLFALIAFTICGDSMSFAPSIPGGKTSPSQATGRDAEKQNGTKEHDLPFEFPRYQPQPIDNDPRTQGMFGPDDEPDSRIGPQPHRPGPAYHPLNNPKE